MKVQIDPLPQHGGQLRNISERFGIPASRLIDFSASINPEGPPASTIAALRSALDSLDVLRTYPDLEEKELKSSIALAVKMNVSTIAVANGFVPLLEATLRTLRIRSCLLPVPAFLEYRRTLERTGVAVTAFPLQQELSFSYGPDHLIHALQKGKYQAILLANPQNPSGSVCDPLMLLRIIAAAAEARIHVLLDEAFIDYMPEHSVARHVMQYANLTVFRSLTKFYGIPGLRVAYSMSNSQQTKLISQYLPPWPITTLAAIGVTACLNDIDFTENTLHKNEIRKKHLLSELRALGLHTYSSATNFLLFKLPSILEQQKCWRRLIVEHGIVVRSCQNFEGLESGHLRCAILNEFNNGRLVEALATLLSDP